ncbi:MAG TPA: PIN domain-containing protein [archaeon]|nr:PIN domain-containing protein [archaeon]
MTGAEAGLIDSNILVYAFDEHDEEKHGKAMRFLSGKAADGNAVVSAQNLAEFHSIVTTKLRKPIKAEASREIISGFSGTIGTIHYNADTVVKAIELQAAYKAPFWDALIAATMLENGVKTIFTENTADFRKIPFIKAVNPLK